MTALVFTAAAVLLVAGVLLLALHHPRQETTMQQEPDRPATAPLESINASCDVSPPTTLPRRFVLQRDVDVSGVSGTGVVAEGVVFSDGTAVIRWVAGEHRSTVVWPDLASVEAIHGHGGATRIAWIDVACRECGCTDEQACFPPCWWVEPDLCSACEAKAADQ